MSDRVPSLTPDARELDDLEMLLLGGYRPLQGFMGPADIATVIAQARLADGTPWPAPVTLVVTEDVARRAADAGHVLDLADEEGTAVARLSVKDSWGVGPDRRGVAGPVYPLAALERGSHRPLRRPAGIRDGDSTDVGGPVLGVPVDCPLHLPRITAVAAAARALGATVRLFPLTGHGSPRGMDAAALVRMCLGVADALGADVVPVAVPRHGGEESPDHLAALVAAAYGATHVPGPLPPQPGGPIVVDLPPVALDARTGRWAEAALVPPTARSARATGEVDEVVRDLLLRGKSVPPDLTHHAVLKELGRAYRPGGGRGFTVLFTGLSGAGKSTIAKAVNAALLERTGRTVTLLDGDVVRRMLSSELGFSRDHRVLNIRRIGYVAAQITRHGGIALCAPIAPYAATRREVRAMVEEHGGFLLVHVSTPLAVCEARDRKGLYAKARAGIVKEFTGVSDPYEEPTDADVRLDTGRLDLDDSVRHVIAAVSARGWLVD